MTAPAEDPRGGEACDCGHPFMNHWQTGKRLCMACPEGDCADFRRAARPAGDRAQPTQELREAIRRLLFWGVDTGKAAEAADAIVALPEVAALLDAQAAVDKMRVLIDHPGLPDATCRKLVRRALDGTT